MNKSIYIIVTCFSFLFICCKSDVKQTNNKEQVTASTKNSIEQSKEKNKKAKNKVPKGNYYQNLQNAINLTNLQVDKLKAISAKYNKKLKSIPKNKAQLIKKTKAQKQQEIKKMMGEKLYLKKVEFDKKL